MASSQIASDIAESQDSPTAVTTIVIAVGSITDFNLVGPFDDMDEALSYAKQVFRKETWEIIQVFAPSALS